MQRKLLISFIFFIYSFGSDAQSLLSTPVSLKVSNQKLGTVLDQIAQQAHFQFSYNSSIVPVDSLVNFQAENLSVAEALDALLRKKYEYKETHNFIIIRYAPFQLSIILKESTGNQNLYIISGQVIDQQTGKPVRNASIYEKSLLQATLTNEEGMFTLRLKNSPKIIVMTASKENYKDMTMLFISEVVVKKKVKKNFEDYLTGDISRIESTRFGKLFTTPAQKVQTENLGGFIARAPVQASLTPGLNTHGSLSGQVINKFSLNVIGTYSAGVDGAEIGMIFNIDKTNVQYFQAAGVFNLVGGNVRGMQVAGIYNNVLDSVQGAQVALGWNNVSGAFTGFQTGGFYNHVRDRFVGTQFSVGYNKTGSTAQGVQIGGLCNYAADSVRGVQLSIGSNLVSGSFRGVQIGGLYNLAAGDVQGIQFSILANHSKGSVNGFQLTGLHNRAEKNFRGCQFAVGYNTVRGKSTGMQLGLLNHAGKNGGTQIGLVNIADSSSGYSIGLLNFVGDGLFRIGISTNDLTYLDLTIHSGNSKLFSILRAGMNTNSSRQLYTIGLGVGTEIYKKQWFSFAPELNSRYLYQGSWEYLNIAGSINANIVLRVNKFFALQAGPAFNIYYSDQHTAVKHYSLVSKKNNFLFNTSSWIGWHAGILLF